MKLVTANEIGVDLDPNYPWRFTFFGLSDISSDDEHRYSQCKKFIKIKYNVNQTVTPSREVTPRNYIGKDFFYDRTHGVKITFPDPDRICLETAQECNEWFQICVQIQLLQLNISMVHAAALAKDGKAVMFPSWGGVGKTACVAEFISEGWTLLGDDIVLLDQEGYVRPYPKDFVIYPYHKALFPEFFATSEKPLLPVFLNDFASRWWPTMRELIRPFPKLLALARKMNPQSRRVRPSRLFPKETIAPLSAKAKLKSCIWLERSPDMNEVSANNIEKEALASKIAAVTIHEVTDQRLKTMLALISGGFLDYTGYYSDPLSIINNGISESKCEILNIPVSVDITNVPEIVLKNVQDVS